MVAKFLDLNKPWSCKYDRKKKRKKMTCMTFLCIIALRNKTVPHTFLQSFTSKWPSLSRNLAAMVTWCHKSPPNSFLCVLYTIHTWSVYQPFTTIEHLASLKVFTVLFFLFCTYERPISNSIEVVRFVFLSKHIFYIIHMHVFYVVALPWQMILFEYLIFL